MLITRSLSYRQTRMNMQIGRVPGVAGKSEFGAWPVLVLTYCLQRTESWSPRHPTHSLCRSPNPQCHGIWDIITSCGGALADGLVPCEERPGCFHQVRIQEVSSLTWEWAFPGTRHAEPPRTGRNVFLSFTGHPVRGALLSQPKLRYAPWWANSCSNSLGLSPHHTDPLSGCL